MLAALIALALSTPVSMPDDVERRLMLTGFDRMRVDGPFVVEVRAGSSGANRVVGTAAALATVQVRVEGRTLIIAPARDDRARMVSGPIPVIELATDRLTGLSVQGMAKVHIERMAGRSIDIALDGDGSISVDALDAESVAATLIGGGALTLRGRSGQGAFLVNGDGAVDAQALTADALSVQSEGSGAGLYRARYTADIVARGSGTVTVDGSPQCHVRGTATIHCGQAGTRSSAG